MDAAYEGKFLLRTSSNANATLVVDESAEDPSGLGRTRTVRYVDRKSIISGDVYWRDDDESAENEGWMVNVWNWNAPVLLRLGMPLKGTTEVLCSKPYVE